MSWLRRVVAATKVGPAVKRVYPGLDEALWTRRRRREMRAEIAAGAYGSRLAGVRGLSGDVRGASGRPNHLIIVPQYARGEATWRPAGGNFFYEITQSAREYAGADKLTIFWVDPDESPAEWHTRLITLAVESGATHVLAQIESDPSAIGISNTWDTFWSQLSTRWDGVFLGLLFDSAFEWITIEARRLARMSPRFMLVDIGLPMDGVLVRGRPEVGPVNMPISRETIEALDRHTAGLKKAYDVSFIGSLYPHRVELLDTLRAAGARVAINPHRQDAAVDFESSRANQPSYLDYMAGLAQSHMTLNFSRASAGPIEQLKTRVLEAAVVGCLVLTDDLDRTGRWFRREEEYAYFSSPNELASVVTRFLSDPVKLAQAQGQARRRAREISVTSFWGGIDEGLARRGLPPIGQA